MAGLHSSLRPTTSLSPSSKLLLLLTLLPLTLAVYAFILQWRGGFDDPSTRWSLLADDDYDQHKFPGMGHSSPAKTSDCWDVLARKHTASFPYFRGWHFDHGSDLNPKICITTSTSAGLEQIIPWLFYHKVTGVSSFILFVEGKAASSNVSKVLESIPGVQVVFRTKELEERQAKSVLLLNTAISAAKQNEFCCRTLSISGNELENLSRIWNETWLANFFYKPCNYELFVKQSLNMEVAIVMAREGGMDWIIHLDTDELVHPAGTREYSVRELFANVPEKVDMVVFPNYESSVERDDIKDPFSEVSMFKKNFDHLPKETYYGNYKEATRGNPNYFLTYGNGKAAARVVDNLRPNGAHRWHNYKKPPREIKLEEAAVLHYTYPKFTDLTSRRDRCGCKPTKEDVKRCFMLDFDRAAFIIASTATEVEMFQWYREHVVWTDEALKLKLIKKGILTRIYAPMIIIEGLRESGTFTSVIESALTNPSKDTLKNHNTSGAHESKVSSSRKMGKHTEIQANGRKILAIPDTDFAAIPPLSPPSIDDIHLDT